MLSKVEELIDPHSDNWDEDLIRDVFSSVDVQRILQIPLHAQMNEDFIAWNYTHSGTFSVRSAYYRELDHQFGSWLTRPDGQGSEHINHIWKDIWRLQVPGKVKHFAWKVLHGVLPCYGVLAARHIPCSHQCPCCLVGAEDLQHCLFKCHHVKEVWSQLGLLDAIQRATVEDRSGSVSMEILSKLDAVSDGLPVAELAVVAAWYLWWQRRQLVKGIVIQTPEKTTLSIRVLATNYIRSMSPKLPTRKK